MVTESTMVYKSDRKRIKKYGIFLKEKPVTLSINVSRDVRERLRKIATKDEFNSMTSIVVGIILKWLRERDREKKGINKKPGK